MDEITKLKAEIFDLQVEYGVVRAKIDEKLQYLNHLMTEQKNAQQRQSG